MPEAKARELGVRGLGGLEVVVVVAGGNPAAALVRPAAPSALGGGLGRNPVGRWLEYPARVGGWESGRRPGVGWMGGDAGCSPGPRGGHLAEAPQPSSAPALPLLFPGVAEDEAGCHPPLPSTLGGLFLLREPQQSQRARGEQVEGSRFKDVGAGSLNLPKA